MLDDPKPDRSCLKSRVTLALADNHACWSFDVNWKEPSGGICLIAGCIQAMDLDNEVMSELWEVETREDLNRVLGKLSRIAFALGKLFFFNIVTTPQWNKMITVLDVDFSLDWINENIWNQNRLPRYILLRRPYRGTGENRTASGEFYLELNQQGGIGPDTKLQDHASRIARYNPCSQFVMVELFWAEKLVDRITGPDIIDILIFDEEGRYTDKMSRRRAEVQAKRQAEVTQ